MNFSQRAKSSFSQRSRDEAAVDQVLGRDHMAIALMHGDIGARAAAAGGSRP